MRVSIEDHFDCHCKTSSQDENSKNMSPMGAVSEVKTRADHIWPFSFLHLIKHTRGQPLAALELSPRC